MRVLVTMQRHPDAAALIDDVRSVGYKIQAAKPVELAIGNIVRRVLHIIREEAQSEELAAQAERADAEEAAAAASGKASTAGKDAKAQPGGPGLLAQQLKVPGAAAGSFSGANRQLFMASRALSLSNLLDVGISGLDLDALMEGGSGLDPIRQAATPAPAPQQAQAQADEVESQLSVRPGKQGGKKFAANWRSKQVIIDAINELIDELENITTSITVQGVEHLHANEVILTLGMSDTTYAFLREAAKKREFQVVVAEGAPRYDGHAMARKLADAGIHVTAISDSAVFGMMARANKVLVGAHAVLANGGIIAPCGIHMVALAARKHSIPFVVLVGLHKLSPMFPHDSDLAYNDFKTPAEIMSYDVLAEAFAQQCATAASDDGLARTQDPINGSVHVPNPAFDYIPPHLISLFITDTGGYTPSYVYRLLTEYYSREDYLLSKEVFSR